MSYIGPVVFPDVSDKVTEFRDRLAAIPPNSQLNGRQRRQKREMLDEVLTELDAHVDGLREFAFNLWEEAGGAEVVEAIDAGVLQLDRIVDEDDEDLGGDVVIERLTARFGQVLADGAAYPLLDAQTGEIVRHGVEEGIFSPVPAARRGGKNAGLAAGLIDHLPSFDNATMTEILDIRGTLAVPLGRFRGAVRDITNGIDVDAYDPDFAAQVHETWVHTVQPAMDELEERMREDTSVRALLGTMARNPSGPLAGGGAAAIQVAAGLPDQWPGIIPLAVTGSVAASRAIHQRRRTFREIRGAQFYFLHSANRRMGRGG